MHSFFKRSLSALLLLSLLVLSAACQTGGETESTTLPESSSDPAAENTNTTEESSGGTAANGLFEIVKDGKSAFRIIRSEDAKETLTKNVSVLHQNINKLTGVRLGIGTDFYRAGSVDYDPESFEILIGETNRAESAEVLASLPDNSYSVTKKNNKLVILGKDDNLTALALIEFSNRILKNPELCEKDRLTLGEENCFTVTLDKPLTLRDILGKRYELVCRSENVMVSERVEDCYVAQGAASDGTYAYFVLRNADDTAAVIKKHRLDDGTLVATSEPMKLGHGNDMTFDAKRNRLVVCTDNNTLGFVDPETLTLQRSISIAKNASGITYSAEKDRYAVSKGGKSLDIFDGEFKLISSHTRSDNTGYVVQGMGSDEDYIYFIMSGQNGKKDNVLVIYSWAGNYIDTITVPVELEGESMYWVNNTYYIAYHRAGKGPSLYRTWFEILCPAL